MASMNKFDEQPKTAYRKSVRKDYGEIVSIDVTHKLIKEFLNAQMYVELGIPTTGDSSRDEQNRELWVSKVKPFFDHMEEILNTL